MNRSTIRGGAALALAVVAVVVILIAGSAMFTTSAQQNVVWPAATPVVRTADTAVLQSETVYSGIYNNVSPSVVSINIVARTPNSQFFSDQGQQDYTAGTGTGFIIDQQGHIVTNAHVVDGAIRIEVNFRDGSIYRGEVVGIDYDSDLAVVKVDRPADELQPVPLGDSDALFIGQEVVALGSPFNEPWTMTTGIISALDRTIDGLNDYQIGQVIQTDAAINPGNSGGPLLNLQGEVIGVNAQILSQSRSNSGVGFAIPSNLVKRVAADLIANGKVDYSYLGIHGGDVDLALIESLHLPNNARGVVVSSVEPGGPAAAAGLHNAGGETQVDGLPTYSSADIITAVNGQPITGMASLISYLASQTKPGDIVTMSVVRDGREAIELPVTLSPRPASSN